MSSNRPTVAAVVASFDRALARTLVALALAALALLATPSSSQVVPAAAKQWNVNNTDKLTGYTDFELYAGSRQLGYDKNGYLITLGWVGHSGGHFRFMRNSGSPNVRDHRAIPADAAVAIYNTMVRRYLRYHRRDATMIELEWTTTPAYEWQLHDQSAAAGRVHFALFNTKVGRYLVQQSKAYGIGLGWYDGSSPPAARTASVALSAQTVVQGWVPYLGRFPVFGGGGGKLLSVVNANQAVTLGFVKPGHSTTECGNPGATERVGPSAAMTADQMRSLYGSTTPALPINFLACVAAPGPGPSLVFINIAYQPGP